MKIKNIFGVILVAVLMTLSACYYDNPPEPEPLILDEISFSTHLVPILKNNCSTANCHDGTSKPNLLEEFAYDELIGGYVNTLFPEESILYKSVEFESGADPMPPGGPQLPELDREIIRLWIVKGAIND